MINDAQQKYIMTLVYEPGKSFHIETSPQNFDALIAQGIIQHALAHYDMIVRTQFQAGMQQQNRLVRANNLPSLSNLKS